MDMETEATVSIFDLLSLQVQRTTFNTNLLQVLKDKLIAKYSPRLTSRLVFVDIVLLLHLRIFFFKDPSSKYRTVATRYLMVKGSDPFCLALDQAPWSRARPPTVPNFRGCF